MSDDTRRTTYETAIHRNLWSRGEHGELNGDVVGAVIAVADAEQEALRQECRDRECTEQDVRARLVDAENTLARVVKVRDAWEQAALSPAAPAFVRLALRDLNEALDGAS